MRDEGIRLLNRTAVTAVAQQKSDIAITLSTGETLRGSHLLVAAGRKPNIESLNLTAAGIAASPSGIVVDAGLRTSNRRVYAIGDAAGGLQFTHVASHQAGLVIRSALFALPVRYRADTMPRTTFTDPELAQVGLTEGEARQRLGDAVRVLRAAFAANDRAIAEGDTRGMVKIVTGRRGIILGAGIVGAGAGDLIQPWVLAIENTLPLKAMAGSVFPYPARGETGRRAAVGHYAGLAANPWVRRIIGLAARLR